MKAWTLAALLVAAVLAERVVARPNSAQDEDEEAQDDEPANEDGPSQPAGPPPQLFSNPLILSQSPGDTVWLPCDVQNVPTVVWLNKTLTLAVNDLRLTFKEDDRLTFHKNHTLQIRNLRPSDAGEFTCKVNDGLQVHHQINMNGNGAPVTRISLSLLLGAVVLLLTRS